MNTDYMDLKTLQTMPGYHKLQALWAHEGQRILEGLQKAASRGQESAWRYYAGQMKGFDLAITHLERALLQMEQEGNIDPSPVEGRTGADILKELRGEMK